MAACTHAQARRNISCRLDGTTYRHYVCLTCSEGWWTLEVVHGPDTPPNVKEHYRRQEAEAKARARVEKPAPLLTTVWSKTP